MAGICELAPGGREWMLYGMSMRGGSKLNHQETAGFSPCFHLPGFHFGYLFLTHSHVCVTTASIPATATAARYYFYCCYTQGICLRATEGFFFEAAVLISVW